MSHRREKRARQLARARNTTFMTALSVQTVLALAAANARAEAPAAAESPAPADQATAGTPAAANDQLLEVVITSYRASVQSALDEKRLSVQPIEAIVAEDIGKMPDQNVAESLE